MTREFPDELLSAFLDGELSPAERAQVEKHLATSEADRLLLAELQSLRSDVAALPPAAVSPDFADRVVRAAVAEAEKHNPAAAAASLPPPAARRTTRRWMVRAAVASAAALAASLLLVLQSWRRSETPQPRSTIAADPGKAAQQLVAASDVFLKTLRDAAPTEGEAVVLRLRISKDVPFAEALDAALLKAGMAPLGANTPTGATELAIAYQRALEAKYGAAAQGAENKAFLDATVAAAQALFVEAPLERLEAVLHDLADGLKRPLDLDAQYKLAFARPKIEQPEGEPGSANQAAKAFAAGQAFAQRLDAAKFRLEKKLADAAKAAVNPSAAPPDSKQLVRVLLLVEIE